VHRPGCRQARSPEMDPPEPAYPGWRSGRLSRMARRSLI
jgi:hypothetical protein